ncbi:MAG: hypothetical protein AAF446_06170, partial [Pseudomonadota bacterium]
MQRYLKLLLALLLMLALAACGGGDNAEDGGDNDVAERADIDGENPFLDRVDADTAYIYANLQRLPNALIEAIWAANDASAASNQQILRAMEEDENTPPETQALLTELMNLATREGWEGAGLSINPKYALHAVSVFPFMHMELDDRTAFDALIQRVEDSLEAPLQRRDVDGENVMWFELDSNFGIAVHVSDNAVSAAVIPDQASLMTRLTNQVEPSDAMSADQLEDFNNSLDFTAHGSGFFDWQRIISELQTPSAELLALDTDGTLSLLSENPACVTELNALTTAMPRMVYGYTELDRDTMDFMLRQETSAELGNALAPITQSPVSIDQPLDGLFNFGMAFDLIAAREFAQNLVNGWVENPPQCPLFHGVTNGAESMQANLNRPIPPMVTNMQGLFIEAMDFNMINGQQPEFTGTVSFFMNNPQLLVGMAQMFSPAVAALELSPGEPPLPVPSEAIPPQLQAMNLQAWIGMGENAIGMAIGEAHIDALEQRLEPTDADP